MNDPKGNQVVWVDIPVLEIDRAIQFYASVLGCSLETMSHEGKTFAILPHTDDTVGGCLGTMDDNAPSATGPLIYLNCQGTHR